MAAADKNEGVRLFYSQEMCLASYLPQIHGSLAGEVVYAVLRQLPGVICEYLLG